MQQEIWESLLPQVSSPARYTDHEWNAQRRPMASAGLRVALAYPGRYEEGVNYFPLAVAYHVLNSQPGCAADRAFIPWPDMGQAMRAAGLPLSGLESRAPLARMHLVGVFLPSARSLAAVPALLSLSGIPLRAGERAAEDPIVIGLGRAAANPEPVAPLLDAVLLGDLEEALVEICEALAGSPDAPRADRLGRLAQIGGVYVPALYGAQAGPPPHPVNSGAPAVVRFRSAPLTEDSFPSDPVVPFVETKGECVQLEVSRGCACNWACCALRYLEGTARTRPIEDSIRLAARALHRTGYDSVSLRGADGFSALEFALLVSECRGSLRGERVRVHLPPLREAHIEALGGLGVPSLEVDAGPACDRLRAVYGLPEMGALTAVLNDAVAAGTRSLRVDITVGMPGETDEDAAEAGRALAELAGWGRQLAGRGRGIRLSAEVRIFIPRPQTNAQWFGMAEPETLRRRLAIIEQAVGRHLRLRLPDVEEALLEAFLSRAGRQAADALCAAACESECGADVPALLGALRGAGFQVDRDACRELPRGEALPWDHLQYAASRHDLIAATSIFEA